MRKPKAKDMDEIPAEIDFSKGVRGKYAVNFPKGSRVIILDADVAKVFPSQQAANDALRSLAEIIKNTKSAPKKQPGAKPIAANAK